MAPLQLAARRAAAARAAGAPRATARRARARAAAPRAGPPGSSAKVDVKLCEYKGGALCVRADKSVADEAAVDAELEEEMAKEFELVRVNFTGSGAAMGHTVKLEMSATFGPGHQHAGQPVPGMTVDDLSVDLKTSNPFPLNHFVQAIVEAGMGQMESKTFPVAFPDDYQSERLRGVTCLFTIMIKEIAEKRPLPARTEADRATLREEIAARHDEQARRASAKRADLAIRNALLDGCEVDTQKTVESVAWAKFGEESIRDYAYSMILEEIGGREGLATQDDIKRFLREEASITWA